MAELYVATGKNRLYAAQQRASANGHADRVRALFQQDKDLADAYHRIAGGKWNHLMAQTRIGYTGWKDPKTNILPELVEITPLSTAAMGV